MSNRERILEAIEQATGPVCDDCLTRHLGLRQRQQAYQRCTELEKAGAIQRGQGTCVVCAKVKKASWALAQGQEAKPVQAVAAISDAVDQVQEQPWYWEGHVQAMIVTHLAKNGYTIRRAANTASKEAGKDIVAVGPDGRELWVSVKGFPTPKGSMNVQARHWFAHAIFDLVLYRGENQKVDLAIGLPEGYPTYVKLAERVVWFRQSLPFRVFWVDSNGQVRVS